MIPIAVDDNGRRQIFQIDYFLGVAEEMSFTRGTQRANIVQSAVSAGIKQLEHDLGSALFLRQGRSIALTQAGEALLPHTRRILADIQGARDAVDASQGTVRGTVKLRQTVQGTRSSLAELRSGTLDLALVSVHNSSDTTIELIPMHSEGISFLCVPATIPCVDASR
ncbi:LysR family transcriptional regulator [Specibacter sp. NPDC078709]|uniref:LysR family transcriptional regulator n=1 Tax=Specibacter sp. NPDC078709 TaxID=3154364 RepID=UPI003413DB14